MRMLRRAWFELPPWQPSPEAPNFDGTSFDRDQVGFQRSAVAWGTVVWGRLLNAGASLFEPGHDVCGVASILYTLGHPRGGDPRELNEAADRIWTDSDEASVDPVVQRFASFMNSEKGKGLGLEVPRSIAPTAIHRVSSMMLYRCRLPTGHLGPFILPIFVHPAPPYVVAPVPHQLWPAEFRELWCDRAKKGLQL
jgi:hypothetical protein